MRRALILILLMASLHTHAAALADSAAEDIPQRGRSRFDYLIGDKGVVFPFARLRAQIEAQLLPQPGLPPVKITLIPFSRSLQRDASAPDFFRFPRVVLAVDGDTRTGVAPLKDKLFLGYNEKAAVLEVISYNEDAGRFEFQLVRDYRAGGKPQIFYARRDLCLACHQNAAPIFARPLWDETPANPAIATRLRAARQDFYGVPLSGTDVAYLIDAAVGRANLIPVWNRLWDEGCGAGASGDACRVQWLAAALRYRLSGVLPDDARLQAIDATIAKRWASLWPQGLAIADANIPNRDPLVFSVDGATANAGQGVTLATQAPASYQLAVLQPLSHIPARLEPLNPRTPFAIWTELPRTAFITGLAQMWSLADIQSLDRVMQKGAAPESVYVLPCRLRRKTQRVAFDCSDKGMRISGSWNANGGGSLDQLSLAGIRVPDSATMQGNFPKFNLLRDGLRLRTADGQALEQLLFQLQGENAQATLILRDEFQQLAPLFSTLITDKQKFQVAEITQALFNRLGARSAVAPPVRLAPPRVESKTRLATAQGIEGDFQTYCGLCHNRSEQQPPNFLHGDAKTVKRNLSHCAPRIFYRLSMWGLPAEARAKTPMPPTAALASHQYTAQSWTQSPALNALRQYATQQLAQTGMTPARILNSRFDALPACLVHE